MKLRCILAMIFGLTHGSGAVGDPFLEPVGVITILNNFYLLQFVTFFVTIS